MDFLDITVTRFTFDLDCLNWDIKGISNIIKGKWGSADFSEIIATIAMNLILNGDYNVIAIDKCLPEVPRINGDSAAGVPDVIMENEIGKIILSVKRFKQYPNQDMYDMAVRILTKSFKNVKEYLDLIDIPGDRYIVILVDNKISAKILNDVYYKLLGEGKILTEEGNKEGENNLTQLRVILIDAEDEIKRLIFHYKREDLTKINDLFIEEEELDISWLQISTSIDDLMLDRLFAL